MEIAPELLSYSIERGGRAMHHPADVLGLMPRVPSEAVQMPFLRISCDSLGLTDDGCDDGADGDQDDLDALSFGDDFALAQPAELRFSVGPDAQGAPGSAVEAQRNCPPGQPGASPEAQGDEFGASLDGTNTLIFDGNGPVGSCQPGFPLGLIEALGVHDNLDALSGSDRPELYASAAELGLRAGDDIDGMCLREDGDGEFGSGDQIYLSLSAGSPTLQTMGAGPGDVLAAGGSVIVGAAALGLSLGDDIDALNCSRLLTRDGASGDVDCDADADNVDAALVLQYDAGLIRSLPCAQNADVNGDDAIGSVDAALILQYEAGLPRFGRTER
jgi:hypothetical protein